MASELPALSNTCTRTRLAWEQAFIRADWAAAPRLIADDIVHEDRRAGLHSLVTGRDAFVESIRVVKDLYKGPVRFDCLATRGDRLALFFLHHDVQDGFVVEFPLVHETNDEQQISVFTIHDDLDAAFDELDERYLVREGAPFADALLLSARLVEVDNAEDWAGLRAIVADDIVLVDRRPASSSEERGAGRLVEHFRNSARRIHAQKIRIATVVDLDTDIVLSDVRVIGRTEAGLAIDSGRLVLSVIEEGRFVRLEYFALDHRAAAEARFADLRT